MARHAKAAGSFGAIVMTEGATVVRCRDRPQHLSRPHRRRTRGSPLFPATDYAAYFNTAAVGLASRPLAAAYHDYVDQWTATGLDYVRGEAAAERARTAVAALIGADRSDVALIASVSSAAGLVAAQFGPADRGHNLVIGEREYSSNHYRSARSSSSTARNSSARCRWPTMELSPTASRFDNSISWLAAIGNEAALTAFNEFGADAVYDRNRELAVLLRASLAEVGWIPVDVPAANRSSIVSVPLGGAEPVRLLAQLKERGVTCSARDGNLRFAVHFYNHEDDIRQATSALAELRSRRG
jgi:selenocysteine lyase/cysteine desulfurase